MDLVSVIVPIYNVEKYLSECIESLIKQTYENIEIILVDDGSTDNSGKICDEYKKKDNRIKVIHKKNGGSSDSRNVGIRKSLGKYLAFVDGDDFVASDFIDCLYKQIKESKKDISSLGMIRFYDNGTTVKYLKKNINKIYSRNEAQKYLNIIGFFNASFCNKLIKKSLFKNVEFPIGKLSEDMYIMYKIIHNSNGLSYNSSEKYYYRQRIGSNTHGKKINWDSLNSVAEEIEFYNENNYDKSIMSYASQLYILTGIGIYNNCIEIFNDKENAQIVRNKVLKYKNKFTYKSLSIPRKLQVFLFIHFICIYNFLIKIFLKIKNKNIK